jgi:hypothetical protein
MKVNTRISPIRQQIDLVIQRTMSPEAQTARVAQVAREQLAEAQEINRQSIGRIPPHESFVNGTRSDRFEDVQPGRSILSRFDIIADLFVWIDEQLIIHSPVLTEAYAKSHTFYADGTEADPARPPEASEFVFLSALPYSRKIERGLSKQAPSEVYEAVTVLAQRRFGNRASISFGYRSPLLSYVAGGANRAERAALRNQPARRSAMAMERDTRVPAIIIRL